MNINLSLDTQVSLEPTPVRWLVGWLVGWLVSWSHFRISNLWSVMVAQIKKNQTTKSIYFQILILGGLSPPSQLVPNPFNRSPKTVF